MRKLIVWAGLVLVVFAMPSAVRAEEPTAVAVSHEVWRQAFWRAYVTTARAEGVEEQDLNTLLTYFIQDMRNGTLGTTVTFSSLGLASGGAGTAKDTTLTATAAGKVSLTGTTPMIQLGGTTASFVAIKQSSTTLQVRLADDSSSANINVNNVVSNGYYNSTTGNASFFGAAPTLGTCAGFGTSPTMGTANGTASFLVNVGSAPPAGGACTINMAAATTGWNCSGEFRTSTATMKETSTTTTTAVFTITGTPTASEVAQLRCFAY